MDGARPEDMMDAEQYEQALAEVSLLDVPTLRSCLVSDTDPKLTVSMGRFTLLIHWHQYRRTGDRFTWHVRKSVRAEACTTPRNLKADRDENLRLSDADFLSEMEAVCGHVREKKTGEATVAPTGSVKALQQAPETDTQASHTPDSTSFFWGV